MIEDIKKALADHKRRRTKASFYTIKAHATEWLSALMEYHEAAEDCGIDDGASIPQLNRYIAARKKLNELGIKDED